MEEYGVEKNAQFPRVSRRCGRAVINANIAFQGLAVLQQPLSITVLGQGNG